MDLMPANLREKLPAIGSEPEIPLKSKTVQARYFDPTSNWRWYALEFDGSDTFFGLVVTTNHAVAGQFTLSELSSLRYEDATLGEVGVELDTYFQPVTVAQLLETEPAVSRLFASSGLDLVGLNPETG